jgi:hypothetical protein
MRWTRSIIWILLVIVAASMAVSFLLESYGVGFLDQEIVVATDRPIRRLLYDCINVDEEVRKRAEETADPRLFDYQEAERQSPQQFRARVMFTDRERLVFGRRVFHPNQLVILIEFDDGRRACRVVDLPKGAHLPAVVVDFR